MDLQLLLRVLLSFLAGALIGLERERAKAEAGEDVPGTRSVGFISVLGCLTTTLSQHPQAPAEVRGLLPASLALLVAIVVGVYTYRKLVVDRVGGVTTPVALALVYSTGLLMGLGLLMEGVALCILTTLALAAKLDVERLVKAVSYRELLPALELGAIVFLIGPLLPLEATDPFFHAVSLGSLYAFFVTILTLSYAGYLAVKLRGAAALNYVAFFGGLAHSEAVIIGASGVASREAIARVALFANAAMILRNALILAVLLWPTDYSAALTYGLAGMLSALAVTYALARGAGESSELMSPELKPFSLGLAARATGLFALVLALSSVAAASLGGTGLLAASVLGGLVSSATVIFSSASLLASHRIDPAVAVASALLATTVAALNKALYARPSLGWRGALRVLAWQLPAAALLAAFATPLLAR